MSRPSSIASLRRLSAPSRRLASAATNASRRRAARSRCGSAPNSPDQAHARRERPAASDLARRFAAPRDHAAGASANASSLLARQLAQPARDFGRDDPLDRAAKRAILERGLARARARNGSPRAGRRDGPRPSPPRRRRCRRGSGLRAGLSCATARWCAGRRTAASAIGAACRRAGPRGRARGPARLADRRASRRDWRHRRACAPGRAASTARRCRRRSGRGRELALHPVFRQPPVALGQVLEQAPDQARVLVLRGLAEIRRLADLPQPHQIGAVAARGGRSVSSRRELAQRRLVLGLFREPQARARAAARRASG